MNDREPTYEEVNRNVDAVVGAMTLVGTYFHGGGIVRDMPDDVRGAAAVVADFFGYDSADSFVNEAMSEDVRGAAAEVGATLSKIFSAAVVRAA